MSMLVAACARAAGGPPASEADRYRGTVEYGCSPVDASAIGFNLQPENGAERPQVGITIWPGGEPVPGERIQLGFDGEGYAAAFVSGTEWTQTTDGEIALEVYESGVRSNGWFWLELSDGQRLEGWFEANWLDGGPVLCG